MPESGNEFGEVGRNIADYCYTRHPRHTAKKVANEIGCELDTAKKWLRGQVPGTKHLFRMIQAWGPDFWACMLEPLDAAEARRVKLDNELKRLEQELGALKKEINTQPKD